MPQDFNLRFITNSILESFSNSITNITKLNTLQKLLQDKVENQKFLFVIDGVWHRNRSGWDRLLAPLSAGARGSKILVTTQSKIVSTAMGASQCYCLEALSKEGFWTLFNREAFRYNSEDLGQELVSIAKRVLGKREGIPLLGKSLGRILSSSSNPSKWFQVLNGRIFELPKENNEIHPALQLSCYHLPARVRQCLAFCSLFPPGHEFQRDKLIYMWKAAGYLHSNGERRYEDVGEELIDELCKMCLLQYVNFPDQYLNFSLPPIIHMLGTYMSSDDCLGLMESQIYQTHISKNARHAVVLDSQAKIDCV